MIKLIYRIRIAYELRSGIQSHYKEYTNICLQDRPLRQSPRVENRIAKAEQQLDADTGGPLV